MPLPEAVYKALDFLRGRKTDYQLVFSSVAGQRVLADLARFCRAEATCFDPDQRKTDALIGRHEVFLRITQHLRFSPEQLYAIYDGNTILLSEDGEEND